ELDLRLDGSSVEELNLSNTGIEILHSSIGSMNKLSCVVTKSKLEPLFDGLESLTLLHLKDCCNLLELPANISSLSSLHELRLDGSSVEELPDSIKSLSKLEVLSLHKCIKLRCLPELPSSIKEFPTKMHFI
ncbi:disease resistance protein, partial [Trifolium medium]|nr:disease resistance protein [Trifolium medium]